MTQAPRLTAMPAEDIATLFVYPIGSDERLTGHFFTMFEHDRWLYSRMRLLAPLDVRALALDLFFLAQKQLPVGTLPAEDAELARLLNLDLHSWREFRAREWSPLYNWHRCMTDAGVRLYHPVVLQSLETAFKRRRVREEASSRDRERKRIDRLATQIVAAGGSRRQAEDPATLQWLDAWLTANCAGNRGLSVITKALEAHAAAFG